MNYANSTSALALLTAAFIASPASAADLGGRASMKDAPVYESSAVPRSWQGPYVALGLGFDANAIDAPVVYDEEKVGGIDLSSDGILITGRIGYYFQRSQFVAGPFADIEWSDTSGTATNFPGFLGGSVKGKFSYALGANMGVVVGQSLLYGGAGWQWKNFNVSGDGPSTDHYKPDGFFLQGGIEASLGDSWTLNPEVRYTWGSDDVDGIKVDDSNWSARARIVKHF